MCTAVGKFAGCCEFRNKVRVTACNIQAVRVINKWDELKEVRAVDATGYAHLYLVFFG
ncbi:hypothetical protein D3C72_2075490 [compost metagenome]